MNKTDKLRKAKEKKNDEYYTYYEDVQRIGERYKDKIIKQLKEEQND